MNSFYGVLGTPACRFYNPALANAITGHRPRDAAVVEGWFESAGLRRALRRHRQPVRALRHDDRGRAARAEAALAASQLNAELATYIAERWRVREPARARVREAVPASSSCRSARHSTRGASKRYAGLVHGARRPSTTSNSSAWKSCAATGRRSRSRCSASSIGGCSPISPSTRTSRTSCGACARGELDDALVYRKNLRKAAEDYTATHAAARCRGAQVDAAAGPPRSAT